MNSPNLLFMHLARNFRQILAYFAKMMRLITSSKRSFSKLHQRANEKHKMPYCSLFCLNSLSYFRHYCSVSSNILGSDSFNTHFQHNNSASRHQIKVVHWLPTMKSVTGYNINISCCYKYYKDDPVYYIFQNTA